MPNVIKNKVDRLKGVSLMMRRGPFLKEMRSKERAEQGMTDSVKDWSVLEERNAECSQCRTLGIFPLIFRHSLRTNWDQNFCIM